YCANVLINDKYTNKYEKIEMISGIKQQIEETFPEECVKFFN
ncbi:MAG: hypothetical protein RLZZ546_2753, partial [Bacteroidota bacterium]